MNPLIPAGTDVAWAILVTAHVLLAIVALISLLRSTEKKARIRTAVFIILVPFAGPLVSLLAMRRSRRTEQDSVASLP